MLLGLHSLGYHLIFIDEHSTNSKDVSPYGWFRQHQSGRFITGYREKSFTTIVAMSELGVNKVDVKQDTNKAADFIIFLESLVAELKIKYDGYLEDISLVFDGALIHAAMSVRLALKRLGVRALM